LPMKSCSKAKQWLAELRRLDINQSLDRCQ
jgi:hypothetical protein